MQRRSAKRQSITNTNALDKIGQTQTADPAKISFYRQKLTKLLSEVSVFDVQIEDRLANTLWSDIDFLKQSKVTEQYSDSLTLTLEQSDSFVTEALPTNKHSFAVLNKREYIS